MGSFHVFVLAAGGFLIVPLLLRGYLAALSRLPSTLLHELAHYLVAWATGSRPTPMDLVPKQGPDGWTLGSVSFCPGFITAGFVALAPLSLLALAGYLWGGANDGTLASGLVRGMLFSSALQGSLPSKTDLVVALRYPFGLVVITTIAALFLHSLPTV